MRFVTGIYKNTEFVGIADKSERFVVHLAEVANQQGKGNNIPKTMLECLIQGEEFLKKAADLMNWAEGKGESSSFFLPIEEVKLLAPIPKPAKNIICIGKNYADHAIEMGSADDIPEHVMVFTKAPTAVIGTNAEILNHQELTQELDYEGELAIVIGKKGRGIPMQSAMDFVFGFTILNDITARDLQMRHKQFFIGKSLDTTCPIGPWIVHKSQIEDPSNLKIESFVNGEKRQDSNTRHFIFSISEIISTLSRGMTLEAGDIIATGTPAGVGKGFKPPRFLKPGDEIEVRIEKIGVLTNRVQF